MSEPIGAGIIGTAHSHARGHLEAIRRSENYNLIAAAEPHPGLLDKARNAPSWSGVHWVSAGELLADRSIQMICVETDPLEALYYALLSIEAGKHTKIDKPPGMNLGLLRKVYEDAARRHLLVQMGYVYRYNPAFRLAHRAIREGWLGPVRSVICQMNDMLSPQGRRRLNRYPGGQMFEICCHMIDLLVWFFGKPLRVTPTLRHSDSVDDGLEDDVQAIFEFDPELAILRSNTKNGERYFHIYGEHGSVQINDPDRPKVRLALSEPHGEYPAGVHQVDVGESVRFLPDLDDLAQAIRERHPVEFFTPEHDLTVQRTLLQACGVNL